MINKMMLSGIFFLTFSCEECYSAQPQDCVVISLGYRCQAAQQMIINGLRTAAYPFDWLITSFDSMYDLLSNDFRDFLEQENLIFLAPPYEDDYGQFKVAKYSYVFDKKNKVIFRHDFPLNQNFLGEYEKVKQKYERRIQRFYETIRSGKFIYFIRRVMSRDQAKLLTELIDSKFPSLKYELVVIDHNEEVKKNWNLPHVKNFYLGFTKPYQRDGDNEGWKKIFQDLGLINLTGRGQNQYATSQSLHQYVNQIYQEV